MGATSVDASSRGESVTEQLYYGFHPIHRFVSCDEGMNAGHSEFLQFTALEIAMNQEAIVDLLRRWLSYQGCGPLIPPGSGPRLAFFNRL